MNERMLILLLVVIMAALLLSGCFFKALKPGKNDPLSAQGTEAPAQRPAGEALTLTAFSHSSSSMSMESCYSYSLTQEEDGVHFHAELFAGRPCTIDALIDEPALEELGAIAGKYHLAEWDGFHKSDSSILDGASFSLYMTLADGKSISAHGSNSFPPHYGDARMEICAVFDKLVDKYGNLYPKTLESDALDHIMLNIKPHENFLQTFSVLAYPSGDMVKMELSFIKIPEYGPDEYSFYGHSKTFPFEEIQSIIRKYDVPSWNGWDESAENYNEAEWFQLDLGYESGEQISAMGTLCPDGYDGFRKEIMELLIDFVRENGDTFVPWQG